MHLFCLILSINFAVCFISLSRKSIRVVRTYLKATVRFITLVILSTLNRGTSLFLTVFVHYWNAFERYLQNISNYPYFSNFCKSIGNEFLIKLLYFILHVLFFLFPVLKTATLVWNQFIFVSDADGTS